MAEVKNKFEQEVRTWNKRFFKKFEFEGLTFDDVLVKPAYSNVLPTGVDLTTRITRNYSLKLPYASANMDKVTEANMAITMAMLGGIGFLWKHPDMKEQGEMLDQVKYKVNGMVYNPISVSPEDTYETVLNKMAKQKNDFSSFVVVNSEGKLEGLVIEDRSQFARKDEKVKDFMIDKPLTTTKKNDIRHAYDMMKKHHVDKLVCIDDNNRPIGLYCWNEVQEVIEGKETMYNRDNMGQLIVGADVGIVDVTSGKDPEKSDCFRRAEMLLKKKCNILLVNTAHGGAENVIETVRLLKENFKQYDYDILAGNIASGEAVAPLIKAGADGIKIGVGPGSICTTRIVAGVGVPQVTAIRDCYKQAFEYAGRRCDSNRFEEIRKHVIPICGDGGIKYSGDVLKAMIAGAESVMMGSLLAGTEESPGEKVTFQGKLYKSYRGMGSVGAMKRSKGAKDRYGQGETKADKLVPEGVEGLVPYVGCLKDFIHQMEGGLRSGMGYVGARCIDDIISRGKFVKITPAGSKESHSHGVMITEEAPNYRR